MDEKTPCVSKVVTQGVDCSLENKSVGRIIFSVGRQYTGHSHLCSLGSLGRGKEA